MATEKQRFRTLMGRFVTGVTVIATRSDGGVCAMTANAITAVSLDPLILLVCIRNESRLLPRLLAERNFSVNILAAEQHDISRHYGGRAACTSPARWATGQLGVPLLSGANASFVCAVDRDHRVGDHTVIYGAVNGMQAADTAAPALVFAAGKYAQLNLTL